LGGLVVVLVAGLAGLAQLKFTSFLAEPVEERLQIVAATSAQDFGAAIDLGLSLDEVANGSAILERASRHDPNIESITVFDVEGNIVHRSGRGGQGRVDVETLDAFRLASAGIAEPSWGVESGDRIASGIVIEGSFGQPIGGIVVEYPTTEMRDQAGVMARQLLTNGLVVVAAMTLVVMAVLRVLRPRLPRLESS
jgi:hypothetical protein